MTDNPKTMTVEEEISDMCKRYATAYIPADMFDEILDVVTRALNQAPKEAQIVCDHQGACDACIKKYQGQGFEQAREMVASEIFKCDLGYANGPCGTCGRCAYAEQIRALKK